MTFCIYSASKEDWWSLNPFINSVSLIFFHGISKASHLIFFHGMSNLFLIIWFPMPNLHLFLSFRKMFTQLLTAALFPSILQIKLENWSVVVLTSGCFRVWGKVIVLVPFSRLQIFIFNCSFIIEGLMITSLLGMVGMYRSRHNLYLYTYQVQIILMSDSTSLRLD